MLRGAWEVRIGNGDTALLEEVSCAAVFGQCCPPELIVCHFFLTWKINDATFLLLPRHLDAQFGINEVPCMNCRIWGDFEIF